MKEIKINEENIIKFIDNLRIQDKEELIYTHGKKYKQKFIEIIFKLDDYYFLSYCNIPIAMGGVVNLNNNKGQVWLLSTNEEYKHRFYLYKYIKNKINLFKNSYDFLFNYIYKSNFEALKWLTKFDFKFKNTENTDFKFFYYIKGENFDL